MNGYRTDFLADIAFGLLFAVAIALMALVDIQTGITFGLGVFLAYPVRPRPISPFGGICSSPRTVFSDYKRI